MQSTIFSRRVVSLSPQRYSWDNFQMRPQMMVGGQHSSTEARIRDLEAELEAERNKVSLLEQLNSSLKLYVSELERGTKKTEIVVQGSDDFYKEEIIKLNKVINEKNTYIQHLEAQYTGSKSTKETLENKFANFHSINTDMEQKLEVLIQENNKLNYELEEKSRNLELAKVQGNDSLRDYYEKRISEFEGKIKKLIEENEKLVSINGSISQEIDTLKFKYRAEESNHNQVYSSYQNQIQFERTTLEERLRIEKNSYENQISVLRTQLTEQSKKYNDCMIEKEKAIDELRSIGGFSQTLQSKINTLEMKLQNAEVSERQISEYIERIAELEHKLSVMITENHKLVELIEKSSVEIGIWREKVNEITIMHSKNVQELKSHYEYEKKLALEQYTVQNTTRFQTEIEKLQNQLKPLEIQMKDLIRQNNELEEIKRENEIEINRLSTDASQKKHFQSEASKFEKLLNEANSVKDDLENKLERILVDNEKLNNILKDRINEVERLRGMAEDSKKLKEEIGLKNDKCLALVERCEEMNEIIEKKNTLISTLQNELKAMQSKLSSNEGQFSSIQLEINSLREEKVRILSKIEIYEKQKLAWGEEKVSLENVNYENQRIQRETYLLKEENARLVRENGSLSREINVLHEDLKGARSSFEDNGLKFTSELERLRGQCEGFKREVFVLKSENERLYGELQISMNKLEDMQQRHRKEIHELKLVENRQISVENNRNEGNYKAIIVENQGLVQKNQNLIHDNKRLLADNEGLLKEIQYIKSIPPPPPPMIDKSEVMFLRSENERLLAILRERDMELDGLRRRSFNKENIPIRIPEVPFSHEKGAYRIYEGVPQIVDRRRVSSFQGPRERENFDIKNLIQENEKLNNDILRKCKTLIKEY